MRHIKSRKRNDKRKIKKVSRRRKMGLLTTLFLYIRMIIDFCIDFAFSYYYDDSKKAIIPPVSKSYMSGSATSIAQSIRKRTLTSEEVVRAYTERINETNKVLNAVTDTRFEAAIEEAKKIDKDIAENNISEKMFEQKPFLGVPFTTKESTACVGMLHTFGLQCRKQVRAKEDADVIAKMKEAGAILIAVTNVPEINLWQETRNCLFGQTLNPYNTMRTTGGSSGGEACIISSCGTAMGIGTDIGGSIRMPAYFCGIMGHKPSSDLISTKGLTRRTGTEKRTMVVAGPMCRKAEDLTPMLKVLVGSNINKLKLDMHVDIQTLKYFYIEESKDAKVSSICSELRQLMGRVVNHFNEELENDQEVTRLDISELKWSHKLWRYWMTQEGSNFAFELTNRCGEINVWTEIIKKLCGMSDYTIAAIFKLIDDKLPKENEQWAKETTNLLKDKLLNELDANGVLIYPSYTWPASYHYTALTRPYNFSYWSIFNVLQFPVTQVPLGLSKDGLPIGLQIVAAPYNDHLCIAVAKYLEDIFGGYVPPFKSS